MARDLSIDDQPIDPRDLTVLELDLPQDCLFQLLDGLSVETTDVVLSFRTKPPNGADLAVKPLLLREQGWPKAPGRRRCSLENIG
jgi:hypothetical protein